MTRRRLPRAVRAGLAAALLALAAGCAQPVPRAASAQPPPPVPLTLPAPTGPHALGTVELHLVDHARPDPLRVPAGPRELMVSVWYPAQPGAGGPEAPYFRPGVAAHYDRMSPEVGIAPGSVDFAGLRTHAAQAAPVVSGTARLPVLLYSPGGGHSRALGTTLVEELASQGYAVVTVDHPFAGPVEFPDRVEPVPDRWGPELMMRQRVGDIRFVLDQLALIAAGTHPDIGRHSLPETLPAALDLSRVGMFGHSAGGFTAAETMVVDDRIDAGANLDGSMDPRYGAAARDGVPRPFLLMGGGTSGSDAHPHHHLGAPDWKAFWERSTGWKRDLHLPAAEHMSFSDLQVILPQLAAALPVPAEALRAMIGTIDPQRSLAAQRTYLTAFFDQHLRDRPTPLFDTGSPEHPDVRIVR